MPIEILISSPGYFGQRSLQSGSLSHFEDHCSLLCESRWEFRRKCLDFVFRLYVPFIFLSHHSNKNKFVISSDSRWTSKILQSTAQVINIVPLKYFSHSIRLLKRNLKYLNSNKFLELSTIHIFFAKKNYAIPILVQNFFSLVPLTLLYAPKEAARRVAQLKCSYTITILNHIGLHGLVVVLILYSKNIYPFKYFHKFALKAEKYWLVGFLSYIDHPLYNCRPLTWIFAKFAIPIKTTNINILYYFQLLPLTW